MARRVGPFVHGHPIIVLRVAILGIIAFFRVYQTDPDCRYFSIVENAVLGPSSTAPR